MAEGKLELLADASKVGRISMLPSEVLELILSFLTLKEGNATSIHSCSWTYPWLLSNKLDFDAAPSFEKLDYLDTRKTVYKKRLLSNKLGLSFEKVDSRKTVDKERDNFIRWVDRFITFSRFLDRSRNLEEFRVVADLTVSHTKWINDWLRYAVSRKVERLELILEDFNIRRGRRCSGNYHTCYIFPYTRGNFPNNLKHLKKLSLHCVSVSGEAVAFLLGNCPLLEGLSLSASQLITSLRIFTTFPAFKWLELSMCNRLEYVILCGSSLVTLKYSGNCIHFWLLSVPRLTELWVKPNHGSLMAVVKMFSSVLSQLEMLKIYSRPKLSWKESREFISRFKMPNLKQLVVNIGQGYSNSLVALLNLSYASPCLQRYVVEATHEYCFRDYCDCPDKFPEENLKAYLNLKEVEFVGYGGKPKQFEVIKHFVENDAVLENVTIDPRSFELCSYRPWDCILVPETKDEIHTRAIAKEQFKELVPSRINVKIL